MDFIAPHSDAILVLAISSMRHTLAAGSRKSRRLH